MSAVTSFCGAFWAFNDGILSENQGLIHVSA